MEEVWKTIPIHTSPPHRKIRVFLHHEPRKTPFPPSPEAEVWGSNPFGRAILLNKINDLHKTARLETGEYGKSMEKHPQTGAARPVLASNKKPALGGLLARVTTGKNSSLQ